MREAIAKNEWDLLVGSLLLSVLHKLQACSSNKKQRRQTDGVQL
jgi:hypothetical protein